MSQFLTVPALATEQSPGRTLFQFSVNGKLLDRFATVSRIRRGSDSEVAGYQRPEAVKHIRAIQKYIESESPMIPNGIVIAFDERVKFSPIVEGNDSSVYGELTIPLDEESLPGWIVDGQQRTAAVRHANVDSFNILATAFITDDAAEQREQFILVNSTKPLPKSLIHELLPGTEGLLPPALARKRLATVILEELNWDESSPFFRRIQTPTNPDGVIKDNSVLRMLENSITDGYLYHFRDPVDGSGDVPKIVAMVNAYWSAVASVFPAEWHSVPRRSRLVHGAGIVAMGHLMDVIADSLAETEVADIDHYEKELLSIRDDCSWMRGEWTLRSGESLVWNQIQNVSRDVQLLTDHIRWLHTNSSNSSRRDIFKL